MYEGYKRGAKVIRVARMGQPLRGDEPVEVRTIADCGISQLGPSPPEIALGVHAYWPGLSGAVASCFLFEETEEPGLTVDFKLAELVLAECEERTIRDANCSQSIRLALHGSKQSAA